jgi:hypothetical protein
MALMEVELPSGFVADMESLPVGKDIKRVDSSKGDTNVIIYLDKVWHRLIQKFLIFCINYNLCVFCR